MAAFYQRQIREEVPGAVLLDLRGDSLTSKRVDLQGTLAILGHLSETESGVKPLLS